ncbi:ATP-grasp domain-containing protein [Candidatus Accumulibacter sp. ACC003]|uniref:ATP-grasp domain-containing protein n=1 Tax=Candidatus Accumulibacter sp. ACC003 TaxID=2823334 RepID=UPI0025C35000|nr:ATP-grasp domain-containing protein [Candidatus Accumulibacter sp. ACC003]
MGYGLLRSMRAAAPQVRLVGSDIYPDAVGQAWCDVFEKAPLTASTGYLDWLLDLIDRQRVDLVIPGIEQDVQRLSDGRDRLVASRCRFAINGALLVDLSRDKWAMHQALLAVQDSSRIPSYLSGDFASLSARLGLPFILKPRRSYASKGLLRISDAAEFARHGKLLGEHLLAQPLVGSDDEEFTVGVFGDGEGRVCASISMQRRLAPDGSTAKAWIRKHASLDDTVKRLCAHFKPLGPTNLQFRRDGTDWKLLEINPRVSSTTSIRTAFGYNEAAMSLGFFLHGKLPVQPRIMDGFAVRFIEDYVVHDRDHF